MQEHELIGLLVGALTALIGLVSAITVPIIRLNSNIVKLNSNIIHIQELDRTWDERLNSHSEDIDNIIERQRSNEKILDLHELRLTSLEEKNKE